MAEGKENKNNQKKSTPPQILNIYTKVSMYSKGIVDN